MKKSIASLVAAAAFAMMLGATGPASAGFITFVSDTGDNGNDCVRVATACRRIGGTGGALEKTDSGGVIHVLPAEYGTTGRNPHDYA